MRYINLRLLTYLLCMAIKHEERKNFTGLSSPLHWPKILVTRMLRGDLFMAADVVCACSVNIVTCRLTFNSPPHTQLLVLTLITGRMPRSGKLPVLNLLTGQKSGSSPRRGDSLHRLMSNLQDRWARGWLCKISPKSPQGWECGPKNIKIFHFLVKIRPAGATPLTDFEIFRGFYTPNYRTITFQISGDSLHRLRSYC